MDEHKPFEEMKALTGQDIDHTARQHPDFGSFEQRMTRHLKMLEFTMLHYLCKVTLFDWARERVKNLKSIVELTDITERYGKV